MMNKIAISASQLKNVSFIMRNSIFLLVAVYYYFFFFFFFFFLAEARLESEKKTIDQDFDSFVNSKKYRYKTSTLIEFMYNSIAHRMV
jgi:hypothetical protein